MSRGNVVSVGGVGGFPRVSGDEPNTYPDARPASWFSPRERG